MVDHQGEIIRWLVRPETHIGHPQMVEHLETHISHVFLAGNDVYKLKKPVKFDFLDFSTLDARERACRDELRLNRRLTHDVYLDLIALTQNARGEFGFHGTGQVVDWLVHMRRLPTAYALDALIKRGEVHREHIHRLVEVLAGFYGTLAPVAMTPEDYRSRVLGHVRGNRKTLVMLNSYLPQSTVKRIHSFQLQLLCLEPGLFDQRVKAGQIVEGHGDLRPEHICLCEPPAIFDCLEFNTDLRQIDVADELAFLIAECDFLGADWIGPTLVGLYLERSKDQVPEILWAFYKSYRACIRAKVAGLRAEQLRASPDSVVAMEARRHLEIADSYVSAWLRPIVLVVGGLAGTGKTTLADALANALGAEILRTDVIRRNLFGASSRAAPPNAGIYRAENKEQVYAELFWQAGNLHADQISVILDGTFLTKERMQRALTICSTNPRSLFLGIECVCSDEVARSRIERRLSKGQDLSDATPDIHFLQRDTREPWCETMPHIQIDTELPLESQVAEVLTWLQRLVAK
jgi:uncharacterized protein